MVSSSLAAGCLWWFPLLLRLVGSSGFLFRSCCWMGYAFSFSGLDLVFSGRSGLRHWVLYRLGFRDTRRLGLPAVEVKIGRSIGDAHRLFGLEL